MNALTRFLDYPELELSLAENSMRPIALGPPHKLTGLSPGR